MKTAEKQLKQDMVFYTLILIIALGLMSTLTSCKKDEKENPQPQPQPQTQLKTCNSDSVVFNGVIYRADAICLIYGLGNVINVVPSSPCAFNPWVYGMENSQEMLAPYGITLERVGQNWQPGSYFVLTTALDYDSVVFKYKGYPPSLPAAWRSETKYFN